MGIIKKKIETNLKNSQNLNDAQTDATSDRRVSQNIFL